ncbi:MAG TPA: hypothetical protein VKW78_09230 [Terriglobales bacterium]|nr:hypothetical protein [Terriglobales bacterium]
MKDRWLQHEWEPTAKAATWSWLAFYGLFLVYAARDKSGFLLIDNVNLVVHEGGHLLFGWFGYWIGIWGGTILQWMVPALLSAYFFAQRKPTAFAFCLFFFFENFLYTATYMADARAMQLPLVSAGGGDYIEHDWNTIFSGLRVLQYDARIAGVIRTCGWAGMLSTATWIGFHGLRSQVQAAELAHGNEVR